MMNPVAITRSTFFTNTDEAKNRGSLPKRKPAFDAVLPFVEPKHFFGALARGWHIGRDDTFGFASGFRSQGGFLDADGAGHSPDLLRRCVGARAAPPRMP